MQIKRLAAGLTLSLFIALGAPISASAASNTVTPANPQGWVFNADPGYRTDYEFTEDEHSTGQGSLYVEPIGGTNKNDKFTAAKELNIPSSDLNSIAYDFQIAGNGDEDDADQFYLNVYTLLPESTASFYDCRFDYTPSTGSTSEFTTALFNASDTPTEVKASGTADCPETLAGLPEGSTVKFFVINVGDTSFNDQGLAGYLDNVVIDRDSGSTTYNFELNPIRVTSKDACKNDGWKASEAPVYKNQGDCVSSFTSKSSNQQPANKPKF